MLDIYIILLILIKILFTVFLYLIAETKKTLALGYLYGVVSCAYFLCVLPLDTYKENTGILDFIFVLSVILFYSIFYSLYSIPTFIKNKIFIKNKKIEKISKVFIFSIFL